MASMEAIRSVRGTHHLGLSRPWTYALERRGNPPRRPCGGIQWPSTKALTAGVTNFRGITEERSPPSRLIKKKGPKRNLAVPEKRTGPCVRQESMGRRAGFPKFHVGYSKD